MGYRGKTTVLEVKNCRLSLHFAGVFAIRIRSVWRRGCPNVFNVKRKDQRLAV